MVRLSDAMRLIGEAEREDRLRLGRLDEHEDALLRQVATGRFVRLGLRTLHLPVYRPARAGRRRPDGRTEVPIHIALGFVSKRRGIVPVALTTHEAAARRGRVYLYPRRGETAALQALGARRDRRFGAWWVTAAQYRAQEAVLRPFAGDAARSAWIVRRSGRGKAKPGAASAFQLYVECAAADEHGRMAQLLHDEEGPVSVGTLGDTPAERAAFWRAVEARERSDGRVQNRAIVEMPHELTPTETRALVRGIVAPLAERALPYHAAVHRPDVEHGSDPRNVHLHILWSERPADRTGPHVWRLAARKDRGAQGPAWVRAFRERTVAAINDALDRAEAARGVRSARRYHPGRYADLGIDKVPGLHLGPSRTALERAAVPTAAGIANALRERLWETLATAAAVAAAQRRLLEVALRPGVGGETADRLAEAAESIGDPRGNTQPGERASTRLAWAQAVQAAPPRGVRGALRARLAGLEAATAGVAATAASPPPCPDPRADPRADQEAARRRHVMLEAVRTAAAAMWSEPDEAARRADRSAVSEGTLHPVAAAVRELGRRAKAARHAEGTLAGIAATAPADGIADPAWERRRARASAKAAAWQAWERHSHDLTTRLIGTETATARAAVLAALAEAPPVASARRRTKRRDHSR